MAKLVYISDFVGRIDLDIRANVYANSIIDKCEVDLLKELLGHWLYNEVDKALVLDPDTQKYTIVEADYPELYKLVYGCEYTNQYGRFEKYNGILNYLRYQVYAFFVETNQNHATKIGQAYFVPENGSLVTDNKALSVANERYNESLQDYYSIIRYIHSNYNNIFTDTNEYAFYCPPQKQLRDRLASTPIRANLQQSNSIKIRQ